MASSSSTGKQIIDKLDLHGGLSVEVAVQKVQERLNFHHENISQTNDSVKLRVITGRGAHSKGNVAKIKPAVKEYLELNGYKCEEDSGEGMFNVYITQNRPSKKEESGDGTTSKLFWIAATAAVTTVVTGVGIVAYKEVKNRQRQNEEQQAAQNQTQNRSSQANNQECTLM